jgi:glycerol-3-phosphate dehydrogenase (NAD(P)+)
VDVPLAERLQDELNSLIFRVYVNEDLGVELVAASKNIIAPRPQVASTGYRGQREVDRDPGCGDGPPGPLGRAGDVPYRGLDLIATCWSHLGRNRLAGELIAQGTSPEDAAAQIGTVEGLTTAPVLRDLARRVGVEMPITSAVCDILEGKSLDDLIAGLMGRRPTAE